MHLLVNIIVKHFCNHATAQFKIKVTLLIENTTITEPFFVT